MIRFLRDGVMSLTLIFAANACATASPVAQLTTPQEVTLDAADTITVFLPHPDGQDAALVNALDTARVDLTVSQNVLGDFRPDRIIMLQGEDTILENLGGAQGLVFTAAVPNAVSAKFKDTKHYTVVIAWLKPDKEGDYIKYLDGIEPAMNRAGGNFLWKLKIPAMPQTKTGEPRYGQITFVEWQDTDGFRNVQKSDEYKAYNKYFGSAIEKFEFHWLKTAGSEL